MISLSEAKVCTTFPKYFLRRAAIFIRWAFILTKDKDITPLQDYSHSSPLALCSLRWYDCMLGGFGNNFSDLDKIASGTWLWLTVLKRIGEVEFACFCLHKFFVAPGASLRGTPAAHSSTQGIFLAAWDNFIRVNRMHNISQLQEWFQACSSRRIKE